MYDILVNYILENEIEKITSREITNLAYDRYYKPNCMLPRLIDNKKLVDEINRRTSDFIYKYEKTYIQRVYKISPADELYKKYGLIKDVNNNID